MIEGGHPTRRMRLMRAMEAQWFPRRQSRHDRPSSGRQSRLEEHVEGTTTAPAFMPEICDRESYVGQDNA
jgi:hypothetical protein